MTAQRAADPSAAAKAAIAAERFRNSMTEKQMTECITELVELKGGKVFHIRDSRHAPEMEAFPDMVIICPPVLAIIEAKSVKRKVTPRQQMVIDLLAECTTLVTGIYRVYQLDEVLELLK